MLSLDELEAVACEQFARMEEEAFDREEASIEVAIDSYVYDIVAARRELKDGVDCEVEAQLVIAGLRGAAYQWLMDDSYPVTRVLGALASSTSERLSR